MADTEPKLVTKEKVKTAADDEVALMYLTNRFFIFTHLYTEKST